MSNFSNLSRQIVPYNITGLQDINVNTINGSGLFSGVVANTNYPLIYNSTTGILSQDPITQNVDYNSNPRFTSINCNSIFNDTGGDLSIDNPYGLIVIGGSVNIAGNIQLYNVITSNKIVLAAENTIDYSLRFPLIRNTVADAPLIVSTPTISGYQTLDYNNQAVKTTSNVNFNSVNIPTGQTYKINNVDINIPNQAVNTTSNVTFNSITTGTITSTSLTSTATNVECAKFFNIPINYAYKIGNNNIVTTTSSITDINAVSTSATLRLNAVVTRIGNTSVPNSGTIRFQSFVNAGNSADFAYFLGNGSYAGTSRADNGYVYLVADGFTSQGIYLSANGICRLSSGNSYIDYYYPNNGGSKYKFYYNLFDSLVPITSTGKITGLSLQAPTHIFTGAGAGIASIVMPNTATSYTLNLPSGLPSVAGSPLISSLTGTLSYNNQAVSTTSDVTFNSVNARITNPYLVYASWVLGATGSLLTSTNVLSSITTAGYRYISYAPNLPTNSNWVNQGGVFASPTYGFTSGTPRLRVPFNGMYQISTTIDIPVYTFVFPNSYTYYQSLMNAFISKNAQNNNDLDGSGCLVSGTLNNSSSPYTARSINLSCQVYLTTSDYICIGLYSEITIPATDLGPRCTLHISLIHGV
jgi:hypothetical protein